MILLSLLSLSACSNSPPVKEVVIQKQYIPLSLLTIDCKIEEGVSTPRLLGAAYVSERACRKAYEKLIDGLIRSYTEEGDKSYGKQ